MNHLRKLYVSDSVFLGYLSLPALEEIVLDKWDDAEDALLPLFVLTELDAPPLGSLSLRRGVLTARTLISLLEHNLSLSTLRLRIHAPDSAVLDELLAQLTVPRTSGPTLAPNLEIIALEMRGGLFSHQLFVDTAQSRF